jgi:preprotein translocase subunit SecF
VYDIVSRRKWYFALSATLIIPGIVFILLGGLKPSIDFTGGTEWEALYASQPSAVEVSNALAELRHPVATVTQLDDGYLRIRTEPIDLIPVEPASPAPSPSASPTADATGSPGETASPASTASPAATESPSTTDTALPSPTPTEEPIAQGTEFAELQDELISRFGDAETRLVRTVGPIIGADLIRSSAILIVIGELFILGYLWMRFGFRYGTAAIIALLHDVLVVVGAFAFLGFFFNFEFDALFVTALLTVIGFSVHDTIIIFDRIRENRVRHSSESFGMIVNHSILQTLARSLITSLTVLLPLAALLMFGPPTITTFTLALFIGILAGTYSSIFNASQILVAWTEWDAKRKARA